MCSKLRHKREKLPPLFTTLLFFPNHSHYLEGVVFVGVAFAFIKLKTKILLQFQNKACFVFNCVNSSYEPDIVLQQV